MYQESQYQKIHIVDQQGNIIGFFNSRSSTERVPSLINVTNSGVVSPGATKVTIANQGNAAGTILDTSISPGTSISFEAPPGDTIGEISYDATGTNFLILTLT